MALEQSKKGIIERVASFMERLNYALGAIAISGALIFPEAAPVLLSFTALQVVEGVAWKWIKDRHSQKANTPSLMIAPT